MSRYEELIEAASDLDQRRKEFKERSYEFVNFLRNSIHEYLDCPDGGIRLFRPSEGFDHNKLVGPAAAEMGDDGFWRMGFALVLGPETAIGWTITYRIMIGTKKDEFVVRFGKTGREFQVPAEGASKSEKMEEVCEEFYRLAHEFLSTPLEERLQDQAKGVEEIGFHATD